MGFKNIKSEFNRTGLIADFISGKYVGNSARKIFGNFGSILISATGGTITTPGNGYKYHFFTSSGDFIVSSVGDSNSVDYLVVAGGGGGGDILSGGGGAGGFRTGSTPVSVQTYVVTVGGGGAQSPLTNGSISSFSTIQSEGGGRGGGGTNGDGTPGGSGGGAGYWEGSPNVGGNGNRVAGTSTPVPNQGNPGGGGGRIPGVSGTGGGGGGAGGAGQSADPLSPIGKGGDGGVGLAAFSGDTGIPPAYGTPGPTAGRWFAGGGGGGPDDRSPGDGPPASGGAGGGGTSASGLNGLGAVPAVVNTGGGGQANSYSATSPASRNGGSGIVIIRYPSPS
jgi:hypothetical protein